MFKVNHSKGVNEWLNARNVAQNQVGVNPVKNASIPFVDSHHFFPNEQFIHLT